MKANILTSESAEMLIQKTGIALFHSVWIGAVIALLAGIAVIATRRSKPELRYNLLTGLLIVFILATGYVFTATQATATGTSVAFPAQPVLNTTAASPASHIISPAQANPSLMPLLMAGLQTNAQLITWLWLAVVALKTAGLLLGLYQLHRLKTQQLHSIGRHWEQRVNRFARQMGIRQTIRIFQSGLVRVPTVLGHFRPVILVPLGVITSIPADQIEMVILHELAHIRRLDFLVNFLQRLVELLFFFNPGILWVSKLIREERENCCDDMALRHAGNQITYIHALLSFREYQLNNGVYQLAFTGKSGIVDRARRIATRTNSTLGITEKSVLALTMAAFLTMTVLFAHSTNMLARPQQSPAKRIIRTEKSQAVANKTRNGPNPLSNPSQSNINITHNAEKANAELPTPALHTRLAPLNDTLQPLQKTQSLQKPQPIQTPEYRVKYHADSSARWQPSQTPLFETRTGIEPAKQYQVSPKPYSVKSQAPSISEKIMTEIELSGIPITRTDIDFRITNNELIVNGVKQTKEVHQRVLGAVLKSADDVIDFTYGSHK